MITQQEKSRMRTKWSEAAIELAMQSKWEEAVDANNAIIENFPGDADAYNRLGKALIELGRYKEARDAYGKALELAPTNIIARKNLSRLSGMREEAREAEGTRTKLDPRIFIEETGKTTVTTLQNIAARDVLAKVTAGDQVYLKVIGRSLVAETERGDYVGQVEPKLGLRIIKLIEAGNRYSAAITGIDGSSIKVIIREEYQAPAMVGHISFPSKAPETGFRPYIKDTIIRYDDEEVLDDEESSDEWDEMPSIREETDLDDALALEEEEEEEE